MKVEELSEQIYDDLVERSERGNERIEEGDYSSASRIFAEALIILPPPVERWEAFTWLKAGVGDAEFLMGNYDKAAEEFFDAMNGPDGYENPFILLRLGQCLYEQKSQKAIDYLCRAYFLEGDKIFAEEDDKFLNAVKFALKID